MSVTTSLSERLRTLTEPEDIRAYFCQSCEVIKNLNAVTLKDRQSEPHRAGQADIHLFYISRVAATMRALAMKYGFSGFFTDRLPSDFEIDAGDSGLPTLTEIRRMDADLLAFRKAPRADDGYGEDLRAQMVEHILHHRTPPRDLQFAHSQRSYARILREEEVFGSRVGPSLVALNKGDKDQQRALVHWGSWDAERNLPIVYLLVIEDSMKRPFSANEERIANLFRTCMELSQSSLHLVTIATRIDAEHPSLRPKSLERLTIGPLQSQRFGRVIPELGRAMSGEPANWRTDWAFGWKLENLRSRGTRTSGGGLFSQARVHESFDIDPKDYDATTHGTTEISRRLLMPYDVFQSLDLPPGNPLLDVPKYVVAPDGEIASQL